MQGMAIGPWLNKARGAQGAVNVQSGEASGDTTHLVLTYATETTIEELWVYPVEKDGRLFVRVREFSGRQGEGVTDPARSELERQVQGGVRE